MKIGVHLNHNKKMQSYLRENGFPLAVPKYFDRGSMRGTWRIYSKIKGGGLAGYERWSAELALKFNTLGFLRWDGSPLDSFSGNGGMFMIFVRKNLEV